MEKGFAPLSHCGASFEWEKSGEMENDDCPLPPKTDEDIWYYFLTDGVDQRTYNVVANFVMGSPGVEYRDGGPPRLLVHSTDVS